MKKYDNIWLPKCSTNIDSSAFGNIKIEGNSKIINTIKQEILGTFDEIFAPLTESYSLTFMLTEQSNLSDEGYQIKETAGQLQIYAKTDKGLLYGLYHLYRLVKQNENLTRIDLCENPVNQIRMMDNWDNMDASDPMGSIERGYAGDSIFFEHSRFIEDKRRVRDYARLLASVGINATTLNNRNVLDSESFLITDRFLADVKEVADIFADYGIKTYVSADFAAPITVGKMDSADPLDESVQTWWADTVKHVYEVIPDFGGFLVKADSEGRPGPMTYGRTIVDGANMMARALQPYGGILFWLCFVYRTQGDWKNRKLDRAKDAYEFFKPFDGQFEYNVILQAKNGPMDFQPREPVSPLFGGLTDCNIVPELQITQEYTGHQIHLNYLVPQWKEFLEFDTFAKGAESTVKKIVDGSLFHRPLSGIVGISNIGNDTNWCGHKLAQANLYGFCRLAWNPELSAEKIAREWTVNTFGNEVQVINVISEMLLTSYETYENYTAPLGIGWMIDVETHYRCDIDSHEYGPWGTAHYAERDGLGCYRTRDESSMVEQYAHENAEKFNDLATCPDELLLFFHHVPYGHVLHSGKTVIQHIYDTHFAGVEQVKKNIENWKLLKDFISPVDFQNVADRLQQQVEAAEDWRDIMNAYFYRKSGVADENGRKIY